MPNLRLAFRTLVRTPFVTLVAIVSLALGIGANTAIFSLFDQMVLRPLPVDAPGELVNLSSPGPKQGSTSADNAGRAESVFSYPMFRDLEREQAPFEGIAGHRLVAVNLAYRGQTTSGEGLVVSGRYFELLGLAPASGRLLRPEDERAIGGEPVAVLDYDYWRTRFEASPTVLNDTLVVNGQPLTIVGVAPRGFRGTTLGARPQVYVPITMYGRIVPGWQGFENRRSYWIYLFARLKPGITLARAQAEITRPYRAIVSEVEAPLQKMSPQTMAQFKAREIRLEPGQRGQSVIHGEARKPLLLLIGVTGLVLLIACANIANLLLARAATRASEIAVRLSIGAGRRQLVAQLLAESCLLALVGALGGLVVAHWTLRVVGSLVPADAAGVMTSSLEPRVLLFAGGLALGTGLLFGLFPALHSTRPDIVSVLKGQAGQPSGARAAARFRTSLATVQIALSMMLLVSAGLFTKSLLNVTRIDVGIQTNRLLLFSLSPELSNYTPEQSRALFARVEEELAALPGVEAATCGSVPLFGNSNWGSSVAVEGFEAGPDTDRDAFFGHVGAGYFRALGIRLLAGREFTNSDALGTARVAVVNEAFTKKFNLGRDAVGKRMSRGGRDLDIEIVGVVQDTKYSAVKQETRPVFFLPYRQDERLGSLFFYARTRMPEDAVIAAVPGVVRRLDPNLPVDGLRTMAAQIEENISADRLISTLSAAFAVLATLLAAMGLYGVLAYTISQRTREIGLRMALGADGARVRGMVLRQVGKMTLAGAVAGLVAAYGLGRAARSLLFELEAHDPAVFAAAAAALVVVAFGAGLVPAHRASRIDPMRALHYE